MVLSKNRMTYSMLVKMGICTNKTWEIANLNEILTNDALLINYL